LQTIESGGGFLLETLLSASSSGPTVRKKYFVVISDQLQINSLTFKDELWRHIIGLSGSDISFGGAFSQNAMTSACLQQLLDKSIKGLDLPPTLQQAVVPMKPVQAAVFDIAASSEPVPVQAREAETAFEATDGEKMKVEEDD
jgi:hypothetical protein